MPGEARPVVMIVDDDPVTLHVLSTTLAHDGFSVIEAKNGQEAVNLYGESQPDVILMDVSMPKMNGLEVLIQIKKRFPNTPVIMSTSESDKEIARTLITEGANDYIVKPFDRPMILQKLKKIVEEINKASSSTQQT